MNRRLKVFKDITKMSHTPGIFDETNEEASINFDDDKFISKLLILVYNIRFDAKSTSTSSYSVLKLLQSSILKPIFLLHSIRPKQCVIPVSLLICVFSYHFHEGVGLNNNLWKRRQIKQFCFWRRILIDCLEVEENQGSSRQCSREILRETITNQQVTIKPLIHTAGFYIDIFSLDIFASATRTRAAEVGCYCFHT